MYFNVPNLINTIMKYSNSNMFEHNVKGYLNLGFSVGLVSRLASQGLKIIIILLIVWNDNINKLYTRTVYTQKQGWEYGDPHLLANYFIIFNVYLFRLKITLHIESPLYLRSSSPKASARSKSARKQIF